MQAVAMIVGRCDRHAFEASQDLCNDCGREFCPECLVYPHGTKRSPICVDCALAKSGVRKHAGRGKVRSRRMLRKERKLLRKRRAEGVDEPVHMMTLDDLAFDVPMADSSAPDVRPMTEAEVRAAEETGDVDAFGSQPTSIVRPSPVAETPESQLDEDAPIPLRDLTRSGAGETSPLEHAPVTDETIHDAFAEPLSADDAVAMVPAGAPRRGYTFDPSLTQVR